MAESLCACARLLKSPVRLRTKSSMFDDVARARLCLTLPGWLLRLCLTRGMSYARVQGLIVVTIVRRDRHVVRLRTRPYRRCHCATRLARRTLASEALSSSPSCNATGMSYARVRGLIVVAIVRCNRHVVRLRRRPYRRRPSGNATGMSCACARGLIAVAIVRCNRHVVRLRTRPYRRRHRVMQPACRALAHEALSSSPVWQRDV